MSGETTSEHQREVESVGGRARQWTLAVVCVATFMLMLDVTVVNVGLQRMRTSLGADFSGLQWVIDAYTLTLAAFLLTAGSLADRLGRKRVFNIGLVIFTGASLAAGIGSDILSVNVARAVQGVGAAVLFAVGPALIGQEFRGRDRGMAFGVFGGVSGLAIALGPMVGGALISGLSWRWIFLINIPVGVLALVASTLRMRESRNPTPHPIDWAGMVVFAAALVLLVLSFLRGESLGWTSAPILSMFAVGVALLIVFVFIQRHRNEAAMLDLSMFRIRTFSGIALATLFSNAACISAIFLQVTYMQNVLGYTPWETGLRFMPQTLLIFVVASAVGALANSVSPGLLVGTSIALIGAGAALATLVTPDSSWTSLLPFMIVTGVGMGIFNPPRAAVTIGVTEPAKAGMASGMGETFQQVGVAIGIAAFGALFHHQVVSAFSASEVGRQLGGQARDLGRDVVASGGSGVAGAVPAGLAERATVAAKAAYVHGLNNIMVMCAIVAGIGSLCAFALIRRSDLHASAVGGPQSPVGSLDTAATGVV